MPRAKPERSASVAVPFPASGPSSSPRKRSSKAKTTAADTPPVGLEILRATKEAGKTHKHTKSTRDGYASYLVRMRNWAASYSLSNGQTGDITFSGPPKQCSGEALALFITFKCLHEKRGVSTAEGAHAAAKKYWEEYEGDLYRGEWRFDEHRSRWVGNPATCAEVRDILKAIKNKANADGGERTHSVAMRYDYLKAIIEWSETECPPAEAMVTPRDVVHRAKVTMHLFFRAFASTGWTIWTRNFETAGLKRKHYRPGHTSPAPLCQPFFKIEVTDRKGWQRKLDKNGELETELEGNTFHIYNQPHLSAANMFHHLPLWLNYLERFHYFRPLCDEEYLFPVIGPNGIIQPHLPVSHDTVQRLLDQFTSAAGIAQKVNGNFTTHTFRRGGAQFRFMLAPAEERWTLARVRWWGGWAKGEHRDTLIRYLLDELYMYEESHIDALQPTATVTDRRNDTEKAVKVEAADVEDLFRNSLLSIQQDITSMVATALAWAVPPQAMQAMSQDSDLIGHVHPSLSYPGDRAPPQAQAPAPWPITTQVSHASSPDPAAASVSRLTVPPLPIQNIALAQGPYWQTPNLASLRDSPLHPPHHLLPSNSEPSIPTGIRQTRLSPASYPLAPSSESSGSSVTPLLHTRSHSLPVLGDGVGIQPLAPSLPPPDARVLNIPILRDGKRDKANAWRDVIELWDVGIPSIKVMPLREWPREWLTGENKTRYAAKYQQRKVIAEEFIQRFARNDHAFLHAYPEAEKGVTVLLKTINEARRMRGDRVERKSKNGDPDERRRRAATVD
ncbi:uncharacterized protein B0H18DRAFT_894363 [Fomitopsis serialis]|uniref:uncharacterized protein n=1 Tax=Fomitopsis serialis TaxID=139415 RepID=UPI0020079CBD|nr:uncharacterized protein B0H18DRAFT_894363 [Neoantrodia serialis]KAH9910809.1 hypothetical protein B0H18DRAFT_894363 [Neoantrodia serialis]